MSFAVIYNLSGEYTWPCHKCNIGFMVPGYFSKTIIWNSRKRIRSGNRFFILNKKLRALLIFLVVLFFVLFSEISINFY